MGIEGLILSNWEQVQSSEYHDWSMDRIVIDTANKSIKTSSEELLDKLSAIDYL